MKSIFLQLVFAFSFSAAAVELICQPASSEDDACRISSPAALSNTTITTDNSNFEIQMNHTRKTTKVTIEDVKIATLPETFFKTFKQLEVLTISRCSIENLGGFRKSRTVQQLYVNDNRLTEIGDRQLSLGLMYLEAKNNRIKTLHKNAFKGLDRLYWIDLSNNRIRKLPKKVFTTPSISSINLSSNKIRDIEKVFRDHENIKYLNLAKNRINNVTVETFMGLVNLKELDLSHNEVELVAITAFDSLRSLKLLKLNQNRLKQIIIVIPSQTLNVLYLDKNVLEELTIFSNQERLSDLSVTAHDNLLTVLRLQEELPLISLTLQNNKLTNIDALSGLKQLEKLNLASNDLSQANVSALPPQLTNLNLEDTNLGAEQLLKVLQLRHLIFSLNISNNTRLSQFKFGQQVPCPVALLQMKNCGFTKLQSTDLKKTFRNLKEVSLGGNDFKCDELRNLVDNLKGSSVTVKAGDGINIVRGSNLVNGIKCL